MSSINPKNRKCISGTLVCHNVTYQAAAHPYKCPILVVSFTPRVIQWCNKMASVHINFRFKLGSTWVELPCKLLMQITPLQPSISYPHMILNIK